MKYRGYRKASQINNGDCCLWAILAKKVFPKAIIYCTSNHVFIKLDGRYYDAERLRGLKHWYSLPFFKDAIPVRRPSFDYLYRHYGGSDQFYKDIQRNILS